MLTVFFWLSNGSYGHRKEISGSIKVRKMSWITELMSASEEGLCFQLDIFDLLSLDSVNISDSN